MDDKYTSEPHTDVTAPRNGTGHHEPTGRPDSTGLREATDLHRTKVPADDPRLKIDRPKSRTLRRGPALAAAAALAAVVVIALVVAITPSSPGADEPKKGNDIDVTSANSITLPDMLRDNPEPSVPVPSRAGADQQTLTSSAATVEGKPAPAPSAGAQRAEAFKQARFEEFVRARGAGIFVAIDDAPGADAPPPQRAAGSAAQSATATHEGSATSATSDSSRTADPNLQERKNDFLTRAGVTSTEYLDKQVTTPRSPYEVKAGTVIPTVLITGINSDLPGQVVGQVRENVYDTLTGNFLLIPQGSRVIAAYDSMVAWGQERVLVCWNRVIRPDGTSITLDCMPGVDLAGYAGFADDVDNHWWRIISGAVFSSLLAATAQRSQGDVTTFQPSFPQVWASGAAGQINQAGQQITAKNLQIQPTITVRPGFSVNVLVSKDIILPPYRP